MDRQKMEFALMMVFMGCSTAVALVGIIAWTIRGRRQPPTLPPGAVERLGAQLDAMQQQLDAMHVEVERVAEGQRFATKLLAERGADQPLGR